MHNMSGSFLRSLRNTTESGSSVDDSTNSRANCQIVYLMGVEGSSHHGLIHVVEALAKHQVDPISKLPYDVDSRSISIRAGLFGWFRPVIQRWGFASDPLPSFSDSDFIQRVVKESCPNDGKKHVIIEWQSFPSGHIANNKRDYRVNRQHKWLSMKADEIANNEEAMQQPANMTAFVQAYSPYMDIKFVVLSRPFLEVMASHPHYDNGPEKHSNIVRGFLIILRRFLDSHMYDLVDGRRLWMMLCVERA
eukprot:CAMPEP_0183745752 /NCGR_PEP_ID=MMETSP0737-20130205/66407_1 /TAXON_ID=385413 /ORGANISM="Thalassiosira miniscula, Strain CCMP1093" /LENGTH=248 /DNA_ID=CAMNT_0025981431 /DNA_START=182 /DNA_END=924 /DNA_ORIENTATION=-